MNPSMPAIWSLRGPPWPGLLLALALFCGGWAASAVAADAVSIRLVYAHNEGAGVAPALNDVAGLLQSNLPFQRFDLAGQGRLPLPADGSVSLAHGIRVRCSGPRQRLQVSISRAGESIVDTTLALAKQRPVILGGIPHAQGRLLVLLVAQ